MIPYNQYHHKTYYVYIIEAVNGDRTIYYTGLTDNIKRRMDEHWAGIKSKYMKQQGLTPVKLVHVERFHHCKPARDREKEIKTMWTPNKLNMIQWTQCGVFGQIVKQDNFVDMRDTYPDMKIGIAQRGNL